MLYKTGLSGASPDEGGPLPRETLRQLLLKEEMPWDKLADSQFGPLFCMEGSLDTWSWSLNVPVLNSLSEDHEVPLWNYCGYLLIIHLISIHIVIILHC
jgi:hypothetical protein